VSTKSIKLFDVSIDRTEELSLQKILKSHFWASGSGIGQVQKFEKAFNNYIKSKSCLAVNSGTAALHLALSLHDIKNKEVILPSLSFVSTAHAILYNGGIPIFSDIDPKTMCLDPSKIEEKISEKTKMVLPVHFGGTPANLNNLRKLSKKHNLVIVEDAAHAAGSSYDNKKIGSHGNTVCFSFHPVKNLAMPTGGAITLNGKNSQKFESLIKSRRWCGITDRVESTYDVKELGWNYYMNEFSAIIGLMQLKKLDKLNKKRQVFAKRYFNELKFDQKMEFNNNYSYHLYWILVKNRKMFMKKLKEKNVEIGIHYKPIHTMTLYKNKVSLPETDLINNHIVSLPIHANLSENDVSKIIKYVNLYNS
jgi:perosamine synthetase